MRFITDLIIAVIFWSFTAFSAVEVYYFFQKNSIQQIERGLNSTVRFTDALLQPND